MSATRRDFIRRSLVAGTALTFATSGRSTLAAANDEIGIGVVGTGGRGGALSKGFSGQSGARIVAVADPDENRAGSLSRSFDGAKAYVDLRKLLDDPAVNVVVVATCNHWHCLAAIMAIEAGKDVYVEKPLSHSQWEGRQVVKAARKHNRIVQIGTQQRSDPMQAELKKFLHEEKALGDIQYVQANRLGRRESIGKRATPLPIPPEVNYDLWLGPALDQPIYREKLHYDWHWDWNTGSGEMGNWGVHVLDDVRNVAYQDSVRTPQRILAVGGRVAWDDAGESPNVHYVYFDTGTYPTLIALSNLSDKPDGRGSWFTKAGRSVQGPGSGYVVACEGGYLLGARQNAKAYDRDGKEIQTWKGGDINALHQRNFLDAVISRDRSSLNAEVEVGHDSTGWCNLANIGYRAAHAYAPNEARKQLGDLPVWGSLLDEMHEQLARFDIPNDELRLSPMLTHDPEAERFTGEDADIGNQFLKREYRAGYEVREIV
ncbi:MAG: Gfo/Idh/MocA family oxidoreductase [Planctomycetaceae bacterium]|nr:Gfo/Idh/MocA family oxidoreductase [Planctomycetaceae bacterium]